MLLPHQSASRVSRSRDAWAVVGVIVAWVLAAVLIRATEPSTIGDARDWNIGGYLAAGLLSLVLGVWGYRRGFLRAGVTAGAIGAAVLATLALGAIEKVVDPNLDPDSPWSLATWAILPATVFYAAAMLIVRRLRHRRVATAVINWIALAYLIVDWLVVLTVRSTEYDYSGEEEVNFRTEAELDAYWNSVFLMLAVTTVVFLGVWWRQRRQSRPG